MCICLFGIYVRVANFAAKSPYFPATVNDRPQQLQLHVSGSISDLY